MVRVDFLFLSSLLSSLSRVPLLPHPTSAHIFHDMHIDDQIFIIVMI